MNYSNGFKARMVQRMAGPEGISARALSEEVGVTRPTLSRWLRMARTVGSMGESGNDGRHQNSKSTKQWKAEDKLRIVQEAAGLSDEELGAFLRREGLHTAQLEEWREIASSAALTALSPSPRSRKPSPESKKIRALEKELHRKEKALAETAALLALQKKVREIWGDEDDDTPTKSET